MLVFFVLMVVSRYLMILILFPLLNMSGYTIDRKDAVILAYGGLRGAIGLCLALMVVTDNYPDRFKDLVLFNLIGMIILTVLVNGLTMKYLMDLIGFIKPNPIREKFMSNLNRSLAIQSFEKINLLKQSKFFKLVDWSKVTEITHIGKMVKMEKQKII